MNEPATDNGPLLAFRDPAYRPLAANLAEVRAMVSAFIASEQSYFNQMTPVGDTR